LLALAAVLLLLVVALGIFLAGGPEFPVETDAIIAEKIKSGPPELVHGSTGFARSGNIKIWYEVVQPSRQPTTKPETVLLIMGAGTSSMLWPPEFIQAMVNKGYQVIRFDHRGTGMSDWITDWQAGKPYSLEDMAGDALAVLDTNDVKRAHIIGVSMGGMIGQRMAISHGDRVLSLVDMSTSAYMFDPALARLSSDFTLEFARLILKYARSGTETDTIKLWMGIVDLMLGDGLRKQDIREISDLVLYEMRKRRGFNQEVMAQHTAAMKVSGSRLGELKTIKCPVLVIHGTDDAAINIAHAKKYAPMIPHVKTLWLEGAGHLIREKHMPIVMDTIFKMFDSSR